MPKNIYIVSLKTVPNKSAGRKSDIELNSLLDTVGEIRFLRRIIATKCACESIQIH